jgi:hypothetical protein
MTFLLACILALLPMQAHGSYLISGKATHYPACSGCAAAGPLLREAIGDYIGKRVRVTYQGRHVDVTLVTSCACGDRNGQPTVIDLSTSAFRRLAPLSVGVLDVEVSPAPRISLPPTDTIEEGDTTR